MALVGKLPYGTDHFTFNLVLFLTTLLTIIMVSLTSYHLLYLFLTWSFDGYDTPSYSVHELPGCKVHGGTMGTITDLCY